MDLATCIRQANEAGWVVDAMRCWETTTAPRDPFLNPDPEVVLARYPTLDWMDLSPAGLSYTVSELATFGVLPPLALLTASNLLEAIKYSRRVLDEN